jgi:stress-induced morphogen
MTVDPVEIGALIRQHIPDAEVNITDLRGDRRQYTVNVASPAFAGLSRVDQHRMVYAALHNRLEFIECMLIRTAAPAGAKRSVP